MIYFVIGAVMVVLIIQAGSIIETYMKYNRDDIELWKYRELKTMLENIQKEIRRD